MSTVPRAVRTNQAAEKDAVFQALADATRREILVVLGGGEMRTSDIAAGFDVSRPAISKHLAVLKRAKLVVERRVGRERRYRIAPEGLRDAAGYVQDVDTFWRERLAKLDKRLRG